MQTDQWRYPFLLGGGKRLGICVRAGDLASMPLLQRFELRSAVRASLYIYTTESEVDRLADTLGRLAQRKDLTR